MLSQTEYGWRRGKNGGEMYPWPGKLLLIAVPLVGAGPAPPCIPFVPPAVAQFPLLALLQVPSAPRLPVPFRLLFSLAQPQGASILRPLCFSLSFLGRPTLLLI